MKPHKIYVAGKFISTDKTLEVINPYTQKVEGTTYMASLENLEDAIAEGQAAEKTMKALPAYKRYEILHHIALAIQQKANIFSDTLAMEAGKPIRYAKAEVNRAIQTFIVAAEETKRLPAEFISLDWTPEAANKEGIVKYFPVGLSAGISPFNFPLNLAVHKIAPAFATACPIVLKPASNTPLTTLLLAEIIDNTALPKGAFSVLPMDREVGNNMVTDDRFKLLTFTGSPEVGWQMKARAGKKKVVLELGGNAGAIICQTADIESAAKRCLMGAFAYSGQICIHTQRIFVHSSKYDAFVNAFLPLVKNLKIGNTRDMQTDFSVMIDEKNAIRVASWIDEAVQQGAKVRHGGNRKGNFVDPTVITDTNKDMKVNYEEVFGPVVTIIPFDNFENAVEELNYGKYGLQSAVFTKDMDEINYGFNHIETGGIIINDVPTFRVDHMPYGGVKDSGMGREGVKYAMHDMLEARLLVKNIT